MGAQYKALDDLMRWIEEGVAPAPGTRYALDEMNQLVLPPSAAERGGHQPLFALPADGRTERLEVAVGRRLTFTVQAEDPDNDLLQIEIDFEGDHAFDGSAPATGAKAAATFNHAYDQPGTYFATARVTHATASVGTPPERLGIRLQGSQNIDQVRIVVE